jgi:hypothetical protein
METYEPLKSPEIRRDDATGRFERKGTLAYHPSLKYRLREFIAGVIASRRTGDQQQPKRGMGWVDLEMRLGWQRCAPTERPLQMLATVG